MSYYKHSIKDFDKSTRISELPMVYIITTGEFEFIKVGKSINFKSRLRNIQSGCPYPVRLWCAIRTPNPAEVERELHKQLKHCKSRGEWFAPKLDDIDYILEFCNLTNRNVKEVRNALLQA